MNELKVEVHQTPGEIACNFDEIEAALRNQMQAYENLEITEENIPERKADVATLRKIKDAIDTRRKEVKKTYDEPLKEFEARVKSVTAIIDEQITRINAELNVFEQKRIAEKQRHNRELYDQNIGEFSEFLPYEVIRSDKWNNKTCKDSDIIYDISECVMKIRKDLETIRAMGSEIEEKCIARYKAAGNDLAAAVKMNADYIDAKKAAEERVRIEEERKAREKAEAEKRAVEEAQRAEEQRVMYEETVPVIDTATGEQVGVAAFPVNPPERSITIRVTGEQNVMDLRGWLTFTEIPYEVIEEVEG